MFAPPYTGNGELDSFLYNVYSSITNVETTINVNTDTGVISNPNNPNNILGFIYKYLNIKFADSNSGLNFSDVCTNKSYFGVHNTDQFIESTNPADYTWIATTEGFGLDKYLWVLLTGNRKIEFYVGATPPDDTAWKVSPIKTINLDSIITEFKKYLTIRFADDAAGLNISTSPVNRLMYGVYTSDTEIASTDPADYDWSPFTYGSTFEPYYRCFGGRQIDIVNAETKPISYIQYQLGKFINLDISTFAAVNSIGIANEDPLSVVSPNRYLLVKFANDSIGTGITDDPTGKLYFGLEASDVIFTDGTPSHYTWFKVPSALVTTTSLWYRSVGSNIITFAYGVDAPDASGWYNASVTNADNTIDVYARSGSVVTDISSPTDGKLSYTQGVNGIYNVSLNQYGQGAETGGFTVDILNTSSLQVDQFGRVIQAGALDQLRYSAFLFTATADQTVFNVSNAQPDQLLVFRNGQHCKYGVDYTRTTTNITFSNGCRVNDVVIIYYIRLIDASTSLDKRPFNTSYATLSNGQTIIPSTYIDGSELLFINGMLVVDSDYTYIGNNSGYVLKQSLTGGDVTIVSFVNNNGNVLVFGENYAETSAGSSLVNFPTSFYRNSTLFWLNGVHLTPTSDYTIPGAGDLTFGISTVGVTNISGQPVQFCTFKSSGQAVVGGVGAAAVVGMEVDIDVPKQPTIKEIIMGLQTQITALEQEVASLKGL